MKIVQVKLENLDQSGETLTTWVDSRNGLKEGAFVTLKDYPNKRWVIVELYNKEHDAKDFEWHRKWDNNI